MRIRTRSPLRSSFVTHAASAFAVLLLCVAQAGAAEEPSGCDKFKWNIDRERAVLTAPDRTKLTTGAELAALPANGVTLGLVPPADGNRAPLRLTVKARALVDEGKTIFDRRGAIFWAPADAAQN